MKFEVLLQARRTSFDCAFKRGRNPSSLCSEVELRTVRKAIASFNVEKRTNVFVPLSSSAEGLTSVRRTDIRRYFRPFGRGCTSIAPLTAVRKFDNGARVDVWLLRFLSTNGSWKILERNELSPKGKLINCVHTPLFTRSKNTRRERERGGHLLTFRRKRTEVSSQP
ncbi:MAG: hypothetical protein ACTS6G_02215 [Candidatus Hodgkinia cicadicola]